MNYTVLNSLGAGEPTRYASFLPSRSYFSTPILAAPVWIGWPTSADGWTVPSPTSIFSPFAIFCTSRLTCPYGADDEGSHDWGFNNGTLTVKSATWNDAFGQAYRWRLRHLRYIVDILVQAGECDVRSSLFSDSKTMRSEPACPSKRLKARLISIASPEFLSIITFLCAPSPQVRRLMKGSYCIR